MLKKITLVAIFLSFQHMSAAQSSPHVIGEESPHQFNILAHIDLNISRVQNIEEPGYSFHGGGIAVYKFSPFVGLHAGLQYNRITGSENVTGTNIEVSANYIDIPFGLTFNYGATTLNYVNLGVFSGIPLSKAKFSSGSGQSEFDAKTIFGLNLDTHTLWPVSETFYLGMHAFFKFAFSNMIDPKHTSSQNTKYTAFGIGLSSRFL